jgi:hypothetical protein
MTAVVSPHILVLGVHLDRGFRFHAVLVHVAQNAVFDAASVAVE